MTQPQNRPDTATSASHAAPVHDAPALADAPVDAVLVVNLGTPSAPTAGAVRRYLAEFLGDPRVVSLSRWLWLPILHGIILPFRSPRVARLYAGVWMAEGSPLAVHTARLTRAMAERLPGLHVEYAMRYGEPALAQALERLRAQGARRVLVLPLYPQYSTTTTASVEDLVAHVAGDITRVVPDYHVDPQWVAAVAASIRAHWEANGRGERLLLSFHGIPQRLVEAGDPYADHCRAGADAIAAALGLAAGEVLLTYQSRFGREPWLQPYTDRTLEALAADGVKQVDVACPGFAVDCLETLEEIALQNAELFREHGGRELRYIPCLNDAPAHADALAALVQRQFAQWA